MKELDIKVGYQCNNNCIFCLNRDKKDFKVFPLEKIKEKINFFTSKEEGKKLIVSGGEPLISKNFFPILDFAKKNGINRFEIQTNGRMLAYEDLVLKLKNYGMVNFLISLHFPNRKLYKKYMQADGFDQVIKGLENLVKFGFDRNFTINTVIMKQNIPYLEEVMELILEKKAPQAQYRFIDGKNVFDNYKDFVPKYKKAASVVRKMVDKYHNEIKMSVREFPICVLGEEYKKFLSPEINNRLNLTLDNKLFNEERIEKEQFCYPNCKNCIYKSRCYGVRKEYYKVYGAKELSPITS